ncbi:hypothetical protein N657DRAFT_321603 [Parathielavia appendiculata]|uniref:Uncharacterized protein n=1 Tax=Parathielavia appendiculata TaxID=2587402 RepID=A0AAN6TQZ9_9PEZI|nr:hypothetical protein N657DRAFT_321603 [Parathielavia appendiculata]
MRHSAFPSPAPQASPAPAQWYVAQQHSHTPPTGKRGLVLGVNGCGDLLGIIRSTRNSSDYSTPYFQLYRSGTGAPCPSNIGSRCRQSTDASRQGSHHEVQNSQNSRLSSQRSEARRLRMDDRARLHP